VVPHWMPAELGLGRGLQKHEVNYIREKQGAARRSYASPTAMGLTPGVLHRQGKNRGWVEQGWLDRLEEGELVTVEEVRGF
jgi:hypothetical protein